MLHACAYAAKVEVHVHKRSHSVQLPVLASVARKRLNILRTEVGAWRKLAQPPLASIAATKGQIAASD